MYRFNILLAFFIVLAACQGQEGEKSRTIASVQESPYTFFGKQIDPSEAVGGQAIYEEYQVLAKVDSIPAKFNAEVLEVCQVKGCWMRVKLTDGHEAMVRFKDYGFFVPTDIAGREVIVNGKAFVDEMSVEDQRHYAKDAGKSVQEIAKITQPKKTYGFLADGVLLKK